jgi:hypothetical protein
MNLQLDVTNRILPHLLINEEHLIIDMRLHVGKGGIRRMYDPKLCSMLLEEVGWHCAEENSRYRVGRENDPRFCYELFYRAFVSGDEGAWMLLYYQFESQVARWVKSDRRFPLTGEPADHFVNDAYTRMFRTLKCLDKELFILRFPTLGTLLAYLKQCVRSSLQDAVVKSESNLEMFELNDEITNDHVWASDPIEEAEYQHELWEAIQRHLTDEEERNVFYDSYVLRLKAPEIMAKYPESFTEVMQVFRIRARILRRLRKDLGLWRFLN